MHMAILKVFSFTLLLIVLFIWSGHRITQISGEGAFTVLGSGISVDNGEQIFWGQGKCSTCHSIGDRGGSVRGPNLGQSIVGPDIAIRAVERANERSVVLGQEITATDYLVESIADPTAFLVDGFKDEMPKVYEPPISLNPEQITSVILYLQSQGGDSDLSAVQLPSVIRLAAELSNNVEPWTPYIDGDSVAGRELFFDLAGPAPCAKCHIVNGEGGNVGPELTNIAGTRTAQFIVESILQPSKQIAGGYESILIQMLDGRLLDGVVKRETEDSLWLATADGVEFAVSTENIDRRRIQELSLMPSDFAEVLSVTSLHDLMAFLQTLQ